MTKRHDSVHDRYTGKDIGVIAVHRLGGALRFVHSEDVAMKAAELSPRRFCWKKYPEQIHLDLVRLVLKNELAQGAPRIAGGVRDGWMLTPIGFAWCISNDRGQGNAALLDRVHGELERVKNTAAFGKALAGRLGDVSTVEIEALLHIDHYTTSRGRKEKALALANTAVLDKELRSVLTMLTDKGFRQLEVQE
jgi:hypothetical protein